LLQLRDYEVALLGSDPGIPLLEHAKQTAELCRLRFPDKDWMHLVGLIHGLGKLLAHPT
jgi:inositol oxygenase